MYSVVDLLNDEGIRNDATFEAWCAARRRKGESRYQTLKRIFGQINADRIMRVIELDLIEPEKVIRDGDGTAEPLALACTIHHISGDHSDSSHGNTKRRKAA